MNDNALVVRFFDRSTLAELPDPAQIGRRIVVERCDGSFPGGFGTASLRVACDPTMPMPFGDNDMVRVFNGPRIVWEGMVGSTGYWFSRNERGVRISCTGLWGHILARRGIDKPWADNTLAQSRWYEPGTAYSGNDQTLKQIETVDRLNGRLRFTPKAVAFTNQWYARLRASAPTGQTWKRFKGSYDMQEAAQAWELTVFNETSAANDLNVTASGTGTFDVTLGLPTQNLFVLFRAGANQTPPSDGTIYGQVDDAISGATALMLYTELGNINAYEVFRDIRAMVPELSADESLISSSLTVSVEPFVTRGREAYSAILERIAGFGTSSYGSIAYGVRDSSWSNDGKPILFASPWPDISADYEWEVSVNDATAEDGFEIVRDTDSIVNWVSVTFQDPANKTVTLTPDDDANLKDTASIARYGERQLTTPLNLGRVGQTAAVQYARSYLARSKDPKVYVSGPLVYRGYIPGKNGTRIPAAHAPSEVTAGVRARIINFATDTLGIAGAGLTMVVSNAEYSDENGGEVRISFGIPDDLAVMLARIPVLQVATQAGNDQNVSAVGSVVSG